MKINQTRFKHQVERQLGVKGLDNFDNDIDKKVIPVYPLNEPQIMQECVSFQSSATGNTTIKTFNANTRIFLTEIHCNLGVTSPGAAGFATAVIEANSTTSQFNRFLNLFLVANSATYQTSGRCTFNKPYELPNNVITLFLTNTPAAQISGFVSFSYYELPA